MTLPSGDVSEKKLCDRSRKLFGIFSDDYAWMEFNTAQIVVTSLLFRQIFTLMIKWVSFSSKSLETLLITITVCGVYSLNYVLLYMEAPFFYESEK